MASFQLIDYNIAWVMRAPSKQGKGSMLLIHAFQRIATKVLRSR